MDRINADNESAIYQFLPSRLPRSYDKWISSAASVDARLIEALQRCRRGELRYGEETGQAALLQSMCQDFGWPLDVSNSQLSLLALLACYR